MVYHLILRKRLRQIFNSVNQGDYSPVLDGFTAQHKHTFFGDHPLAGQRSNMVLTRQWYARLVDMMPNLQFKLKSVASSGPPWATIAMVEWEDEFSAQGETFNNQGVHALELRWGRVSALRIYCDTQKVASACETLAGFGVDAARQPPIEDGSAQH